MKISRFARRHIFLAAETATGGGGTEQPLTLEQKLEKSAGDLKAATDLLNEAATARDTALAELATAQVENQRLTEQFNSATAGAETLRGELATAQGAVTSLTTERDGLKTSLDTATKNTARLEKLCGVHGVDPKSAIPVEPEGSGTKTMTFAEFKALPSEAQNTFIRNGGKVS